MPTAWRCIRCGQRLEEFVRHDCPSLERRPNPALEELFAGGIFVLVALAVVVALYTFHGVPQ